MTGKINLIWLLMGKTLLGIFFFLNSGNICNIYASDAGIPGKQPVYAKCGPGDSLWICNVEPVDSPATIHAMFERMASTYKIKRMYWREERIVDKYYKIGNVDLSVYDWNNWKSYLNNDVKIHEAALEAARKNNMEIFFYYGLFEHGVQPDVGVNCPYIIEDEIRINHPEWCPLDRWGQRRAPGPLSFCYPQVRKLLVDCYANHVIRNNYDGINFYTYVENLGLRYLHEFGFEQPVVEEFNKKYPAVNLRKDTLALTQEQKEYWYFCQGIFVTQFLRELHAALAPEGKKISMILNAKQPDYVQPWWGKPMPGTGMIHMDWERWVDEGIVDEFWVEIGESQDQKATLDRVLAKCAGTKTKITLRSQKPFDKIWAPYVDAGVTPVAGGSWKKNGIERYSLEPTSLDTLKSPDWKLRGQTLDDIAEGKLSNVTAAVVAPLARDPHVLVRRKAMYALAALADPKSVTVLENGLFDPETSVNIAAAVALNKFNGPKTPQRIIEALKDKYRFQFKWPFIALKKARFQFKMPCVDALANMKEKSLPVLLSGLNNPNPGVREVCIRALGKGKLGKTNMLDQVFQPIRNVMLNPQEEYQNRCWAIDGLVDLRMGMNAHQRQQFITDLNQILQQDNIPSTIQIHAVQGLGRLAPLIIAPEQRKQTLDNLHGLFAKYGDNCTRDDAAYGWRVVGNAMLKFGQPGKDLLEAMRAQTKDKWLAWVAYEVVYLRQDWPLKSFDLVDEAQAIEEHNKYAPAFPGWRKW